MPYDTLVSFTVTNLHSLANSATGGWQSAVVDNSSNLFADAHVFVVLDFANTAPADSRAAFIYAYGGVETGVYTNPASGSEGTITLPNITTSPPVLHHIGTAYYNTADEIVEAGPFSVCRGVGVSILPKFWGLVIMNHSGAALHSSGNTVKYLPITSA